MSWLAGITHKMMVLGSSMYLVYGCGILPYHFGGNLMDVFILPFDSYAGESRQIDDSKVRAVSRMHI